MKLKIEDLENNLESVINKYNNLINKYNNLVNIKKEESRKINNKNNCTLNNFKIKLTDRSNVSTLNNSNEKIISKINIYRNNDKNSNKLKNILIQGNCQSINSFDNDYINHLKKENERLNKIIITYETKNNNNCQKKYPNLLKRNYLINNKIKRISEKAKRSISKKNSKENSYIMKAYNSKNFNNKNNLNNINTKKINNNMNNKSSLLFLMKQNNSINKKNNITDYSIITDSSLIIHKNKKIPEIQKNKDNFKSINANSINKNGNLYKNNLKKNNTNINSISRRGIINNKNKTNNNYPNKRMINKLNVNNIDTVINNSINNNLIRDKIKNKFTPKSIIKNNGSFFARSNNNFIKAKNDKKIRSFKLFNLDNNYININITDIKNSTSSTYFYNEISKNHEEKEHNNILKTEINNNTNLIHRNTENMIRNKCRLIKEFKTEKNNLNKENNKNDDIFFTDKNNLSNNDIGIQKITINRKNIFCKKSQNSLRDAFNNNNNQKMKTINNEINSKRINNTQLLNTNIINNKMIKTFPLDEKKINISNNSIRINNYNKNLQNDKNLSFYQNKKINDNTVKIPSLRNNQIKNQSKTINNISNFNNCNYIYLFNNGEK